MTGVFAGFAGTSPTELAEEQQFETLQTYIKVRGNPETRRLPALVLSLAVILCPRPALRPDRHGDKAQYPVPLPAHLCCAHVSPHQYGGGRDLLYLVVCLHSHITGSMPTGKKLLGPPDSRKMLQF